MKRGGTFSPSSLIGQNWAQPTPQAVTSGGLASLSGQLGPSIPEWLVMLASLRHMLHVGKGGI